MLTEASGGENAEEETEPEEVKGQIKVLMNKHVVADLHSPLNVVQ